MITTLAFNLVGINLLAYIMIILRPRIYKSNLYRPMLKNIRLSIVPIFVLIITVFLCLSFLQWSHNTNSNILRIISLILLLGGFTAWLLMLPNSGYLITELNFNHREQDTVDVPLWYDIVSILSLAMSGVLNMCFNVLALQFLITVAVNNKYHADMMGLWSDLVTIILLLLCSFGIYLGRYIRLNSWDVKHPLQFISKLKKHYSKKGTLINCYFFVFFHLIFFLVFYYATMGYTAKFVLQDLGHIWAQ